MLAAGYDTRAYRFARQLRGRPVFEVDHPATSQRKGRIVEQHLDELLHPEDAEPFVARLGFRVREIADATVLRQRYFKPSVYIYPTNYLLHAVVGRR